MASQAPQSLPAISQPPQSSTMGYMGSQAVSMGYQPYGVQVRPCGVSVQGRGLGAHWAGSALLITTPFPSTGSPCWFSSISAVTGSFNPPQNLMTTLPSQDAPLPPPQQPYISGQQPLYQQVSLLGPLPRGPCPQLGGGPGKSEQGGQGYCLQTYPGGSRAVTSR